jgi:hypothetical protein
MIAAAYLPFIKNLKEMEKTHLSKNHDYAGDGGTYFNFEYAAMVAEPFTGTDKVFATMLGIKLARLAILKRTKARPKNEPIIDTQKDLATYATIWWTYLCEEEAKRVQRRRLRTRSWKRVSKASSRRRGPCPGRSKTTNSLGRVNGEGPRRTNATPRVNPRRKVRN